MPTCTPSSLHMAWASVDGTPTAIPSPNNIAHSESRNNGQGQPVKAFHFHPLAGSFRALDFNWAREDRPVAGLSSC